jgi:hypothetical protein
MSNETRARTISLPVAVWDKLKALADLEKRSVNSQIAVILERAVEKPAQ